MVLNPIQFGNQVIKLGKTVVVGEGAFIGNVIGGTGEGVDGVYGWA